MSTDSVNLGKSTPVEPVPAPAQPAAATSTGTLTTDPGQPAAGGFPAPDGGFPAPDGGFPAPGSEAVAEPRPAGWIERHTPLLISLLVAIIVVAVAIAGLVWYRHTTDRDNSATEAAFTKSVASQGAKVDTVECHGDTCAAVISGTAYTVLVQKDSAGNQHFGVSAYVGH